MSRPRIIVLEFNELCPPLLDRWMESGDLPTFRAFFDESEVFTTTADVSDPAYLEPWIQWYSIHTGLPFERHGVFRLTDGPRADHDDIWHMLLREGKRVINFSSMNARPFESSDGVYLPDPWCPSDQTSPDDLSAYHRFVSRAVQGYTNPDEQVKASDYSDFLRFLISHGLKSATALALAKQILGERTFASGSRWKRAALLDRIQFDLFAHYFRRLMPDFSTFFINSTAHYQHAYWRYMEPESFKEKPSQEEIDRYGDAVLFGYRQMDKLLKRFLSLAGGDCDLVLCTALSQQAFRGRADGSAQRYYRPRDLQRLLSALGVSFETAEPVMAHQFMLRAQPEDVLRAANILKGVTVNGAPAIEVDVRNERSVYFGTNIDFVVPADSRLDWNGGQDSCPFFELFYAIEELKSGCHHPDGVLWFRTGDHRVHEDKVSILDILPTLLNRLEVRIPDSVAGSGKVLLKHARDSHKAAA